MRLTWKELKTQTMTAAERKRARSLARGDLARLKLRELRGALSLTQTELARKLKSSQVAISRLESRTDMRVSTLRDYARGLGGELEIYVSFPGKRVRLIGSKVPAPVRRISKSGKSKTK